MATRTRTPAANPDDQPSDNWQVAIDADPSIEIEESAQDRVFAMLKDTRDAQSATVKLYRVNPGTKKLGWCQDYSVEEFESGGFENIRAIWGAGTYEIRLYGPTEGGKFACLGRTPIEIIAPIAAPASAGQSSTALDRFIEAQQRFNEQMLAAITAKPDPMTNMKEMFSIMTMMREAMGLTNQPQAQQKSSIAEIMEAVREMRAVAEEINPPKEDASDDPMAIVGKIADLVGKAMQNPQAAAQLQQQFPAVTLPPSVQLPIAVPVAQPQALASSDPVTHQQTITDAAADEAAAMEVLRAKFRTVINLASLWKDMPVDQRPVSSMIGDAAEIVYEFLPEEAVDLLRSESWFDGLKMIEPSCAEHREFLALVRTAALAIFDEEAKQ